MFVDIAAPIKAHDTDNHNAEQLIKPTFPYNHPIIIVTENAYKGAKIQNTISWAVLLTPHQYTITIPKLRFVAAISHPK